MSARLLRRALIDPFTAELQRELGREVLGSCGSLLDLGCGNASPVRHLSGRLDRCVGVDAFEPYLRESIAAKIHSEVHQLDVMDIEERFGPRSFDCIVALDLIEHLPKEDGLRLLEIMERVAAKKVIVFTPNGFVPQRSYDGNPFQEHHSGWTPEEMQRLGYRVRGLSGWKPLRGERSYPRWRPHRLWGTLALWTQPLVRSRPASAFHLLCVKDLSELA